MKGYLLLATGHPMYSHYAFNAAAAIRCNSKLPIALIHEGAGLSQLFDNQREVFDQLIPIDPELLKENGIRQDIKGKLSLYDLSPFDETVFLDVDLTISPMRKLDELFDQEFPLQFGCRGEKTMEEGVRSEWVKLPEIKKIFGFTHWYDLSSEFIYFKKSPEVKNVFDDAKYFYSNHGMGIKRWIGDKLEDKEDSIMEFAGGVPDEVPFALSLEKNNFKIRAPYTPIYWQPQFFNKMISDTEVKKNYYGISIGGAVLQPNTERIYNQLTKHYIPRLGIDREPYKAVVKMRELPERKRI